ncbi:MULTISPECIES: TIR domain-containing protein [unclassified Bradyrhizobium]|uniref:cobaltochelatase CobT-related protein n=1 Tax=unclassified Bradyrhizobium TaxID=2631580 RepID=UPI0033947127
MQTGESFAIFQDRNDISWGQQWEERIERSLSDATFLIPIVTPSFFRSPACRSEFSIFARKEKLLGLNRLILPLYYITCDQLSATYEVGSDEIVETLKLRNWTDWRHFRFKQFVEEPVASALAEMAAMIKGSIRELEAIGNLSRAKATSQNQVATSESLQAPDLEEAASLTEETIFEDASPTESANEIPVYSPDSTASYCAYTKDYDEVVEASELVERAELVRLHRFIQRRSKVLRTIHGEALGSFLSPFTPIADAPPLCVSVLIDNSGSMRGEPITMTAAWCNLIAEWMDKLRISTEFLGFTTRAWKGGQSKERWIAAGKPTNPGRLNDLRHLVYKSFSASVGASAPNFGMMAREGLLKENIDGEAVLWAFARLQQQRSSHKMLIVISDGAPVDDTTLSVNRPDYLEQHLQEVIESISGKVRLHAIGIGTDVSPCYPNAATITNSSDIGPRFFEVLVNDELFQSSYHSSEPRKRYRYIAPKST